MKKLTAYILVLASLSVGCLLPTIGAFAMSSGDTSTVESMSHDMHGNMWMHSMPEDDTEDIHECCESPLVDMVIPVSSTSISQIDIDDDSNILYAMYESLIHNSNHRLNSPPQSYYIFQNHLKSSYTSLIGIVKNNS